MTDQRSLNTLPASYKDVTFRIRDEVQDNFGRKLVLHEFPNSNSRFIEDLGLHAKSFSVTAFVHTEFFLDDADALDNVLEDPGPGTLVLPVLGTFRNVYAAPGSKTSNQDSIGEIVYNIKFYVGRPTAGPTRRPTIFQDVADRGSIFRYLAGIDFGQIWALVSDAGSLLANANDLEFLTRGTLDLISNFVETPQLAKILRTVSKIEGNPGNLINSAGSISEALFGSNTTDGLWGEISLGFKDGDGLDAALEAAKYGTGSQLDTGNINGANVDNDNVYDPPISLWPETTVIRKNRNRNRISLVNAFRTAALSVAYEQAAQKTYLTSDQVQATREKLEEAYIRITQPGTVDTKAFQAQSNTLKSLSNLRSSALNVLKQKEQDASKSITLNNIASYSVYNLAYKLYEENIFSEDDIESNAQILRNMNPNLNSMDFKRSVRIFSE